MAVHKPIQRWSAARKRDVVLRLLRGESIETVSRRGLRHGLVNAISLWAR
jgi:hypothetical protein